MSPEEIAAIPDPELRAKMAMTLMQEANELAAEAQRLRDMAFSALRHEQHQSVRQIAAKFGVSKTLVATVTG